MWGEEMWVEVDSNRQISRGYWPARLAEMMSFRLTENSYLKIR